MSGSDKRMGKICKSQSHFCILCRGRSSNDERACLPQERERQRETYRNPPPLLLQQGVLQLRLPRYLLRDYICMGKEGRGVRFCPLSLPSSMPLSSFPSCRRPRQTISQSTDQIRQRSPFHSFSPSLSPSLPPLQLTNLLPGFESSVLPGVPPPIVVIGVVARRSRRKQQTGRHGGRQNILGMHARSHAHAWVSPQPSHPCSSPRAQRGGRRVDVNDLRGLAGRPLSVCDVGGCIVVHHVPAVVATVYCVRVRGVVVWGRALNQNRT